MNKKRQRQAALMDLVRRRAVRNQNEIVAALRKRGIRATQASVSRDVRELGLVKVDGRYFPVQRLREQLGADRPESPIAELIISLEPVGANLIVIKTPPGSANPVAVDLDSRDLPGVAGTVAGDDTVFVAVRSRSAQGRVLAMLESLIPRR